MKIIRVVHNITSEEMAIPKENINLQYYQPSDFMNLHEKFLLEQGYTTISLKLIHGMIESASDENEIKAAIRPLILHSVETLLDDLRGATNQIEVLSFEQAQNCYPETRNLTIGTYTIHPRNKAMLTRLESYHRDLAMEKDHELITLLGEMGAYKVTIVENNRNQNQGGVKIGVENMVVNVGGGFDLAQRIENGKALRVEFKGTTSNRNPNLLQDSLWFSQDGQLHSILRSRLSENPMIRYELLNTYTETFDFDFDLAAKYLVLKADLRAEYQTLSQIERLFVVDFH